MLVLITQESELALISKGKCDTFISKESVLPLFSNESVLLLFRKKSALPLFSKEDLLPSSSKECVLPLVNSIRRKTHFMFFACYLHHLAVKTLPRHSSVHYDRNYDS